MKTSNFILLFSLLALNGLYAKELNSERTKQVRLKLELAESLQKEGQLDMAILLYREFIELYPDSPLVPRAYRASAQILEQGQYYMRAIRVYARLYELLGISEEGLGFYFRQGVLYEKLGIDQQARRIYEDIQRLKPESAMAEKAARQLRLLKLIPLRKQE